MPLTGDGSAIWRRARINGWAVKVETRPADDLTGLKITKRIEIPGHTHTRIASATSIVTRLTSISSPKGIGLAVPSRTDETNADAQALCPLSCRHKFIVLNPGHPKPASLRKLS